MTLSEKVKPDYQGKVRDIYDLGDKLLLVASDRVSAFDYVLPDTIPFKGEVLNRLSIFWYEFFDMLMESHFISAEMADFPEPFKSYPEELAGRSMLVHKCEMFKIECIVRGYLSGSALAEYQEKGSISGVEQPVGLQDSDMLEHPMYTPTTKAPIGEHDMPLTLDESFQLLGEGPGTALASNSLMLYNIGRDLARSRGLIIADTKFEFGLLDGRLVIADEVLTPDSSRFWPMDDYEPGRPQKSFDKQIVRDWLKANWDFKGEPPRLPRDIIEATSKRYIEAYELLTQTEFVPMVG
ncbi:MAG: phosphoribosylaminoimidazolesuccinocarboxamide synthase [Coriobacteriia bacterium]|nr:phosphoribosylaminoimidazolesuccinocarboxamide synthase [Coriobacteriia bacterium]